MIKKFVPYRLPMESRSGIGTSTINGITNVLQPTSNEERKWCELWIYNFWDTKLLQPIASSCMIFTRKGCNNQCLVYLYQFEVYSLNSSRMIRDFSEVSNFTGHFSNSTGSFVTTPFIVFSLTYNICKGPKLDAYNSQSVVPINCQYDIICPQQQLFKLKEHYITTFSVTYWDTLDDILRFSMQGGDVIKHTNGKCHVLSFQYP